MNDKEINKILYKIEFYNKVKSILTLFCYILIFLGLMVYVFYIFQKSSVLKIVYNKDLSKMESKKVMINPNIKFEYKENEIYSIQAKKAFQKDEKEIILVDIIAENNVGKILAGELKIINNDRMIFSKNPVLTFKIEEK